MKRAALIFDLDGTLVDSMPDLQASLNEMLRGMGRRELTPDEVRRMIGDGTRALVERALTTTGSIVDFEAAHQRFLLCYEAAPTKLSRLYPGVASTSNRCARQERVVQFAPTNRRQRPWLY